MEPKKTNGLREQAECSTNQTGQSKVSNSPIQSQSAPFRHRNEVHLAGVLANEPEIRYTTTGKCVCNFKVVTTYQKANEYHRVTAWEHQAEMLKRFHKDDFIKLVGRLQSRSYEKDGKKSWVTEVVAWNLSDGTTEKNGHGVEVSDADIPF